MGVRLGDGSNAPSLGRNTHNIDGRVVPLPSTATHDPIVVRKPLWTRWNSLDATTKTIQNDWNEHLGRNGSRSIYPNCGFTHDRDVIGAINIVKKHLLDVGRMPLAPKGVPRPPRRVVRDYCEVWRRGTTHPSKTYSNLGWEEEEYEEDSNA